MPGSLHSWLAMLLLLLLYSTIAQIAAAEQEDAEEGVVLHSLMSIYNATNGPHWSLRHQWGNMSVSPCVWFGVCCDADASLILQGQSQSNLERENQFPSCSLSRKPPYCCATTGSNVTLLQLNGNNLQGILPDAIGQLTSLQLLDLSYNEIRGTFPVALLNLTQLRDLRLAGNRLTGSLPQNIGDLHRLQFFSLSKNKVTGTLPDSMGTWQELRTLLLAQNMFTGGLPATMEQCHNLISLDVADNPLNSEFPSWIVKLPALSVLGFRSTGMRGPLPTNIGVLQALEVLQLSNNPITGTLPESLTQLSHLRILDLAGTQLGGSIPATIGSLLQLLSLVLRDSQYSGAIPSSITNLKKLDTLDLSGNTLSETIPADLGEMTTLKVLSLSNNQLSGSLPTSLSQLTLLMQLLVSDNQLGGTIPSDIGNLVGLEQLDLSYNALSGTIPASLASLTQLHALNLTANHFHGNISVIIDHSQMTELSILLLSSNSFSGSIAPGFGRMTFMTEVDLSQNLFAGELPSDLGSLHDLRYLNVESNKFKGRLPRNIWLLPQLLVLKLAYNGFDDYISSENAPLSCLYTSQLSVIDISHNRMEGNLTFFKYFPKLSMLNCRNNFLSGVAELTFFQQNGFAADGACETANTLGQLTQLDLTENRFTSLGTLPSTLSVFRIPRNDLSGPVTSLSSLRDVMFIDIQSNPRLLGDFPIQLLQSLRIQYLFFNDTGLITSHYPSLPPGLEFSPTKVTAFIVYGEGNSLSSMDQIECPTIVSSLGLSLFVSVSPSYYQYATCSCGVGQHGTGPSCYQCPVGTYNNISTQRTCDPCPPQTYAPTPGAVQCSECNFPLYFAYSKGTKCLDLTPLVFIIPLLVFAAPVVLAAVAVFVILIILATFRALRAYNARKLHLATLLIQQRAREEIPADLLIPYRDLKMEERVGAGSFSQIYQGRWKHTIVAIKELTGIKGLLANLEAETNSQVSEDDLRDTTDAQKLVNEFRSEVLVMSRLHHPNILLLVGACSDFPHLCIVTEYLRHGSLYDALHARDRKELITSHLQVQWLSETASGMNYLHQQGLMHRDLKSLNVLLDDVWHAKLCDFGLAKVLGDASQQRNMTSGIGSILWMAPELLMEDEYSFSADVYSWGIVAWEIMSPGEQLYPEISQYDIPRRIVAGMRPPQSPVWPVCICSVMSKSWDASATLRPSFDDIVVQLKCLHTVDPASGSSDKAFKQNHNILRIDKGDFDMKVPLLPAAQ